MSSNDLAKNNPNNAPSPAAQMERFEFSKEELEFIAQERRKQFFSFRKSFTPYFRAVLDKVKSNRFR